MQGFNRLFLLGRLGSDPKPYTAATGEPYIGLSVATQRKNRDPEDPNSKGATDWHFVRVWGKHAENCQKYLTKGQGVMIEAYLTPYTRLKPGTSEPERKIGITAIRVEFLPRTKPTEVELN